MKLLRLGAAAAAIFLLSVSPGGAKTIKVGVIGPFSGPFSVFGTNFQWGIQAFVAKHGAKVGGDDIEFVYRDLEGVNPAKSKSLAQELIVKDKVQYLAGAYFTPNAMAMLPLLAQANVPLVVMNAATSSITAKSPYVVRTSFTMWQNTVPAAKTALERGLKKAAIAVSDYGPGKDAQAAFTKTFENGGGAVTESVRMSMKTKDFSPVLQRLKDSKPDVIFAFLPGGPPTLAFVKAFIENGLKADGIQLITTGDLLTEPDLPALGEAGVGLTSTYHYSAAHDSPENRAFIAAATSVGADEGKITMTAVAAYDGAQVIYKMIEATGGEMDAAKAVGAVVGTSWESPRGPVSIDPVTRHITQNVYLREVVSEGGRYFNRELKTFASQPDYGLAGK
jgi:branched-chain amino acid transport system substrate-binding protein